jgi:hypothetical protein
MEDKWISMKDRFPEFSNYYNIVSQGIVCTGYYSDLDSCFINPTDKEPYENVTHWRLLPEPPNKD